MAVADVVHEEQIPCAATLSPASEDELWAHIEKLTAKAVAELESQGFTKDAVRVEAFLNLRYRGTECPIMTPPVENELLQLSAVQRGLMGGFAKTFEVCYKREFGFVLPERDVLVDDVRVRATGINKLLERATQPGSAAAPTPIGTADMYFEQGKVNTPLYRVNDLRDGQKVGGPAVLIEANSTIVVEADCVASVDGYVPCRVPGRAPRTCLPVPLALHSTTQSAPGVPLPTPKSDGAARLPPVVSPATSTVYILHPRRATPDSPARFQPAANAMLC